MKSARVSLLLVLTFWIAVVGLRNLSATIRTVEIHLTLRTWIHPFKNSSEWTPASFEQTIPSNQTAIIICDMWDKHWCNGATTRVELLAHRMEPVLEQARAKSILIIHAPSETMSYYANAPGRLLAEQAVKVNPPAAILPTKEPQLPIDDTDGGCDTAGDKQYKA